MLCKIFAIDNCMAAGGDAPGLPDPGEGKLETNITLRVGG